MQVIRLLVNDGDYLVRTSRNKKSNESQIVLSVMWSGHKHFIIHGEPGVPQLEALLEAAIECLAHSITQFTVSALDAPSTASDRLI